MSAHNQHDTAALPASRRLPPGRAGYDYFADEQHYGSLVGRVLAWLRQGGRIALITGDPPIDPLSLAMALTEATAGKYTVLAITCGGDFNEEQLRGAAGPSPLFLFNQADRLSDGQLAKLCSYLASGGNRPAGVLLGGAHLAARLERLRPCLFEDRRAIRFNFYELGRDEIEAFIRRQLCPSKTADAFSMDEIDWIAGLSSGDPAQVNRLSRLILEFAGNVGASGAQGDSTSQQVPMPSAPRSRRAMRRPVPIGILLCLGIGISLTVAGRPEFGGRIGAPAESRSDGSLAPKQAAALPPAVVAAPTSAESSKSAEPAGALATAETAPPPPAPLLALSAAETTVSSAEPPPAPAAAETAMPRAEPLPASAAAETAPAPDKPVAASATAETAPSPAEPLPTPAAAETAPAPDKSVVASAAAETAPSPAEPLPTLAAAETAPAPDKPVAASAAAETAPQDVSAGAGAEKAWAPRPLPDKQIAMLLARGDAFMQTRDITSARLLYERAADAGNGRAALRMGESFDPAFLDRIGIYRSVGDRTLALSWYRRARDLGDPDGAQLLEKLEPR